MEDKLDYSFVCPKKYFIGKFRDLFPQWNTLDESEKLIEYASQYTIIDQNQNEISYADYIRSSICGVIEAEPVETNLQKDLQCADQTFDAVFRKVATFVQNLTP